MESGDSSQCCDYKPEKGVFESTVEKAFPSCSGCAALSEASTRIAAIINIPGVMASSVDIQSIFPSGPGILADLEAAIDLKAEMLAPGDR